MYHYGYRKEIDVKNLAECMYKMEDFMSQFPSYKIFDAHVCTDSCFAKCDGTKTCKICTNEMAREAFTWFGVSRNQPTDYLVPMITMKGLNPNYNAVNETAYQAKIDSTVFPGQNPQFVKNAHRMWTNKYVTGRKKEEILYEEVLLTFLKCLALKYSPTVFDNAPEDLPPATSNYFERMEIKDEEEASKSILDYKNNFK